ncbi:amino acid adenylation domain-containing protein [Streptomyces sp. 1331.2]|uniref:amino acid adenylation domain-containing protein n=1 Tax=Streptomyces sp. 1331.2 TaxID=1938835 RepID=UPI000BCC7D4E|nr:amino acid adenylation domain-containing protein [Streptomyces sp. 1331.2]SOB78890.1 amino acid adenylation domain-containing protein [Streptomyces sp. 1331.2]
MEALSIGYGRPHRDGAVLDLFTTWVHRTPDAPALIDGEHVHSYAELDRLADSVAQTLRGKVGPGDLLGVCLGHSVSLVAVTLAAAKLGAVHLPLGPRPGERRLRAVAEQLRPVCLVGAPDLLPPGGERLPLDLPTGGVVAALTPGEQVRVPAGTHYAVLTSGSTGTPKAVAVTEPALGALLHWYRELTGLGPGSRHSLLIGVAFDPHLQDLWAPLTAGAALVVAPEAVRWDTGALTDWWREAGITVSVLPTPLAEPVLGKPWPTGLALRHLMIGGDRLRRAPGPDVTATVHNAYGPAEATVVTTVHTMAPGGDHGAGAPPIGRPIPGAIVLVTDQDGRPVPRGVPGELRIGGRGLAAGYLDPELTARRFVGAPEGVDGTDRVYRTGDRVLMRADGLLEFQGRLDDQVKISGVRIEPGEVEAAFERDPRVRRAVVAAEQAPAGGVRLLAFVQLDGSDEGEGEGEGGGEGGGVDAGADPARLLDAVRPWLPEQAVPSAVRLVDRYPLDANGKVDRAALLAAEPPQPAGEDGDTPVERTVLKLCRELIGRADLVPTDNFLASGGNSLAAARLLEALQSEYGIRLRAPLVLRQPDLRALARLVEERVDALTTTA